MYSMAQAEESEGPGVSEPNSTAHRTRPLPVRQLLPVSRRPGIQGGGAPNPQMRPNKRGKEPSMVPRLARLRYAASCYEAYPWPGEGEGIEEEV